MWVYILCQESAWGHMGQVKHVRITASLHPTRAPTWTTPGPHTCACRCPGLDQAAAVRMWVNPMQCNSTQAARLVQVTCTRRVCEERQRASGRKSFLQEQVLLLLLPNLSKAQHVWVAGADIRDG